jgi:uncharacterized membrane protein YidH (DUF202 family)
MPDLRLFSSFGQREPNIAAKKPARVEPKSYFANERTFIQWISAGLLLLTLSAAILILLDRQTGRERWALVTGIYVI